MSEAGCIRPTLRQTFSGYQEWTAKTAVYPDAGKRTEAAVNYCIVAVGDEVGELLGKHKKFLRGDYDFEEMKKRIRSEIGDVLYEMTRLCEELGFNLGDIAFENQDKLIDRKARGVLKGEGDNR